MSAQEDNEEKEVGGSEGQNNDSSNNQEAPDATEILLRKVASVLAEKSVNYAIVINDGASPRWIVSDVYWMLGVFHLISRHIEAGWDEDFYENKYGEEDEEDE